MRTLLINHTLKIISRIIFDIFDYQALCRPYLIFWAEKKINIYEYETKYKIRYFRKKQILNFIKRKKRRIDKQLYEKQLKENNHHKGISINLQIYLYNLPCPEIRVADREFVPPSPQLTSTTLGHHQFTFAFIR